MKSQVIERIIETWSPRIDRGLEISKKEYAERWARVQAAMRKKGYDLGYACGGELDRSDVAWLAGVFDPIIERYGILVPAEGRPVVVAGSEGGHVIEECVKVSGVEVALLREFQISDEDYRFAKFGTVEDVVGRLVPARPGRTPKIAVFSSAQFVPHDQIGILTGRFGGDNVVFDTDLLRRIKYEKTAAELKLCGMANAVADAAFLGMLAALKPGIRELDLAAVADYVMKRLGARRTGFPTIVSSGTRGRTVLGPATNKVIGKGEIVSMGISPTFNGYHGIMRRTVKAGADWTFAERVFLETLEGLYHKVMRATAEAAKKGLPASSIDRAGKKYLERTQIKSKRGEFRTPREPYTFIHNTGCSECQEGFGAVTPFTDEPLGKNVALMIDVAFMGFDERKNLVFPVEYAVIEDAFWKKGKATGVYNRLPLEVQDFVGGERADVPKSRLNPCFR
ncbi:MAG: M24 family metallopeptidase, partial [Candidatus Aminicenantales bacterium]